MEGLRARYYISLPGEKRAMDNIHLTLMVSAGYKSDIDPSSLGALLQQNDESIEKIVFYIKTHTLKRGNIVTVLA